MTMAQLRHLEIGIDATEWASYYKGISDSETQSIHTTTITIHSFITRILL